ncbi:MAG: cellulase family glycosylhydrolase [Chloroflexota bacterium]
MKRAWLLLLALLTYGLFVPLDGGLVQMTAAADNVLGLHVVGNQIRNGANQVVRLRGVNRPSAEYACIQNWGIIHGETDAASIQAMLNWRINVVRLPLNEDCWLDVNMTELNPAFRGSNYRNSIIDYVNRLTQAGIAVILDLHWSAPGAQKATGQLPMPDRDHSLAFWQSVATTFKSNTAVIFDLFNEPWPDNNRDTVAAWSCLRDGTTLAGSCPHVGYAAAGMQDLVNTVRATGATNLMMIPGVGYTGLLTRWIEYLPTDPLSPPNLAASTHIYPGFSWCPDLACWNQQLAPIAAAYPLIAGEMGQMSCAHNLIDGVIDWMESKQQHYLAWAWWTEPCGAPAYYGLITGYTTGAPSSGYGQGYRDRLVTLTQPLSFIATASVAPASQIPGGMVGISAEVTSATNSVALVDVEVHDAQGQKVFQEYFENQAFSAGVKRTYPVTWPIPANGAPGAYRVQVGVFSPDWATLYTYNSNAVQILVVAAPSPTPTRVPTACSPRPPITVYALPDAGNRLQVSVTVSGAGNTLQSIQFSTNSRTAGNAIIDTATQTDLSPPFTLGPFSAGSASAVFWVRRAQPGRSVTVPMTVTDDCGAWTTFVGGGAGAF